MPSKPLNSISAAGTVRAAASGTNGPADDFSSTNIVSDAGILQRACNCGVEKHALRGDGVQRVPILTATPASTTNGDFWFQRITGQDFLAFKDSTGVIRYFDYTALGGTCPVPVAYALIAGGPGTNKIAEVTVDTVGIIEWTVGLIHAVNGYRHIMTLTAVHDGTAAADAVNVDLMTRGGATIGTNDITFLLNLNGVGAAQKMRLFADTLVAGWAAYIVDERFTA